MQKKVLGRQEPSSFCAQRALAGSVLQPPLQNSSPRVAIRPLHLNFSPEPLLIFHPSELCVTFSDCLRMLPRKCYSTFMPHTFHLFAHTFHRDARWWDGIPPQRASSFSRLGHTPPRVRLSHSPGMAKFTEAKHSFVLSGTLGHIQFRMHL